MKNMSGGCSNWRLLNLFHFDTLLRLFLNSHFCNIIWRRVGGATRNSPNKSHKIKSDQSLQQTL